jgi:hypothetical protein
LQGFALINKGRGAYFLLSTSVLLGILFFRGFGAFSRVEIEETFNSGFMMSHNFFGIFTAQMYQAVTSKFLAEIALFFPMDVLPRTSFYLSILFWLISLTFIQALVLKNTGNKGTALIAAVLVSLVPLPLHGGQGLG